VRAVPVGRDVLDLLALAHHGTLDEVLLAEPVELLPNLVLGDALLAGDVLDIDRAGPIGMLAMQRPADIRANPVLQRWPSHARSLPISRIAMCPG
jgi:hypothetical protein